jgi:hypothetical protein
MGMVDDEDEVGRGADWCGGEGELVTSSAFPSRDRERRIREVGVDAVSSIRSGHEAGWLAWVLDGN